MDGIDRVFPSAVTDPAFAAAWEEAIRAGVEIKMLRCHIREDGFDIL